MASTAFTIRVKREGLLLHMYAAETNKLLCTTDLRKELELSDEQAAQLLAKLDEDDTRKADEVIHENTSLRHASCKA